MRRYPLPAFVGLGVAMLVACTGQMATAPQPWSVVQAVPPGVTLIEPDRDYLHASIRERHAALGNEQGAKLYVLDSDATPGASSCTGICAESWKPFAAPVDAKPSGDWTIVAHDINGTWQWAYRQKPLYRPAHGRDPVAEETTFDPSHQSTANPEEPPKVEAVTDWHVALFKPELGVAAPPGISVQNITAGGGYGLIDRNGMTLYAFDGNAKADHQACLEKGCTSEWKPLLASELMQAVGDFSLAVRHDGTQQWAYKGEPLYTFSGDLVPGSVAGQDVDRRWHAALLVRYFIPANVTIDTRTHGTTLTSRNGQTLYTRNPFVFQAGGFDIYPGFLRAYSKGKILGAKGCDENCLRSWHPFVAPADATPWGFWEVITRADGTRQWVYKGYALYTYSGDSKPGEVNGNNVFDLIQNDNGPYTMADAGRGAGRGASALFWHIAMP